MEYPDRGWELADRYFRSHSLAHQSINSFNAFLSKSIREIVESFGRITVFQKDYSSGEKTVGKWRLTFDPASIRIGPPSSPESSGEMCPLSPDMARLRDFTYACPIYCDVTFDTAPSPKSVCPLMQNTPTVVMKQVLICMLPAMLGCSSAPMSPFVGDDCVCDPGGYFIVNGAGKCMPAFESSAPNNLMVLNATAAQSRKYSHVAEIWSCANSDAMRRARPVKVMVSNNAEDGTFVAISNLKDGRLPLSVVFCALGVCQAKDMVNLIVDHNPMPPGTDDLLGSLNQIPQLNTQHACLKYLGARGSAVGVCLDDRIAWAIEFLRYDLFPHVGITEESFPAKAAYLGLMVRRLYMTKLGARPVDDKDNTANKRYKLAGDIMHRTFALAFRHGVKNARLAIGTMMKKMQKLSKFPGDPDIRGILENAETSITSSVGYVLATGNLDDMVGVTQNLDVFNYLSLISHIRRSVVTSKETSRGIDQRMLHSTIWGMLCPVETPEGKQCGIVKNFSLLAEVSLNSEIGILPGLSPLGSGGTLVTLNQCPVGNTNNPLDFTAEIIKRRRHGQIPAGVSIRYCIEENEITIRSDRGRVMRPCIIAKAFVEFGSTKIVYENWDSVIRNGLVEYLDVTEECSAYIAMELSKINVNRHTHAELHPSLILGCVAAMSPFEDHNQGPKNLSQTAMAKQSIGIPYLNFQRRMDTGPAVHILRYPQKPICGTRPGKLACAEEVLPTGQCPIVGICTRGYNQEDSLEIKKSAIDRGFAVSDCYRTHKFAHTRDRGAKDPKRKYLPENEIAHLDIDGVPGLGTRVGGNTIIGYSIDSSGKEHIERSRSDENSIVDKVLLTKNSKGESIAKVRTLATRVPQIGDKFAARHGQKGTIGIITREEDMPFSQDGITPDILMNPHAIPSRMTIGQLIECLESKVGALNLCPVDSTAFVGHSVKEMAETLKSLGFSPYGDESFCDGRTGVRNDAKLFCGPVHYQKLKHMVEDKIHARARGPISVHSRQPVKGRARDGGLRFGEMERDCLISHGARGAMQAIMLLASDKCDIHVCEKCGLLADYNFNTKERECKGCGRAGVVSMISVPYVWKTLTQELLSMSITVRMIPE